MSRWYETKSRDAMVRELERIELQLSQGGLDPYQICLLQGTKFAIRWYLKEESIVPHKLHERQTHRSCDMDEHINPWNGDMGSMPGFTAGRRVVFLGKNGTDGDKAQARESGLDITKIYTVEKSSCGRYTSSVELREFPGVHFNTVMFDFLSV